MLIKVTMIKFQYVDTMGYYTIIKMSQQQLPIKTWMEHTHTHIMKHGMKDCHNVMHTIIGI